MKLLIVSQYFWPENFRINELAASLVERGHKVTVLTSVPNYPEGNIYPDYKANPEAFCAYNGIEIIRIPQMVRKSSNIRLIANYLSFAVSASLIGAWRLRGRPFDAVFVFQTSPVTVGIPGGLIAALKRAPMLMWILDCWPETLKAINVGAGPIAQSLVGLLVRAIYASADLLLGQSKGFVHNVEKYSSAGKFRHFPNWVEGSYLAPTENVAPHPDVPPQPSHCFTVAYAGNIGEAQDFPAVVAAAGMLRNQDIRFLIIGEGRDLARTQADVTARGLDTLFHFAGRHPADSMPAFFAHADALLVSLKQDPLFALTVPGKVQTYLAAGRPILGMLDGEGAEVIQLSGAGRAVPAGDSAALAEAVIELKRMDAMARATMGKRGRAYAQAVYDRETLVTELESWIADLRER